MTNPFGDFLDLNVRWRDETRYGSLLSRRLSDTIRFTLHPRTWALLSAEMEKQPLLRKKLRSQDLRSMIFEERRSETYRRITADNQFWRPDPTAVQIEGFGLRSEVSGDSMTINVAAADCRALRSWLRTGEANIPAFATLAKRMAASIGQTGYQRIVLPYSEKGPQMVGHGCVTWSDGEVRLWIDPYLRPKRLRYPLGQQPISPLDTPEEKHVVLITHSHPDHFSPESLLLFPGDAVIIVPRTDQENLLTIDMGLRARQLGFEDVRVLACNDCAEIAGFTIIAMPFFGEQPLGSYAARDRAERNQGATYRVSGPNALTALFLADSGSDSCDSMLRTARHVHRSFAKVDFVFGNHRRWRIFPPQYLTTSVPQNICFVPDSELGIPQATMLTPEELGVIGESLGARFLIPYAMGNAPWFAEIGLGSDVRNNDHAGMFDCGITEKDDIDDPDSIVSPAAQYTALSPGDHIGLEGRWRDPSLEPIDPTMFSTKSRPSLTRGRVMSIGGALDRQTVCDLLELTRVAPDAYLVSAPGFVEIVTQEPGEAEFVWNLALRLISEFDWILWSSVPLVAGSFATDAGWMSLFDNLHARSGGLIRDKVSDLGSLGAIVDELRLHAPAEAIQTIAWEMLGITIHVTRKRELAVQEDPHSRIELPAAANALIRDFGSSAVTWALLLVKLLHNFVLTRQAVSDVEATDEASVFQEMLGAPASYI